MTTTLGSMEDTIKLIKENNLNCKIMVGGAVLTPEYAEKIGADFYSKDDKAICRYSKTGYWINTQKDLYFEINQNRGL